jgi:hypothetical protein
MSCVAGDRGFTRSEWSLGVPAGSRRARPRTRTRLSLLVSESHAGASHLTKGGRISASRGAALDFFLPAVSPCSCHLPLTQIPALLPDRFQGRGSVDRNLGWLPNLPRVETGKHPRIIRHADLDSGYCHG